MDFVINATVDENKVVDGLNATDFFYLMEQMELLGKLASNN